MGNDDYALRPEAGPVKPAFLNQSQRDAFRAIVAALAEARHLAATSVQPAGLLGAVQRDRVSRLFFVSGQPGSGKTSLYLTLRAILDPQEQFLDLRQEYAENEDFKDLSELVDRTRWLECIDLEVAVDEGENLLAAVLVRIFHAITETFDAPQDCQDVLRELEELANDIGIAWEGNLQARAGSLDPDSYSQEVIRAQRTRLRINERFRSSLQSLFEKQCFGLTPQQLFVLPIDDFYLKPAASLELLRLLSMISVPRLFFLVMGDIKTVEALFLEKALADWTAVAGPRIFASLADRQQEVLARVREMRARYLRKLLPIRQRAIVEWTEWSETLAYRPAVSRKTDWVPQMAHLLSEVKIKWSAKSDTEAKGDKEEHSLLNFLLTPRLPKPPEKEDYHYKAEQVEVKKFHKAYSGTLVLDATPRELFDLWRVLRELQRIRPRAKGTDADDEEVPQYLRMFVDLALSAIEEQDFLYEKEQDILRFAFPSSGRTDFLVRTNEFCLKQKVGPWIPNTSDEVWVRKHLDWELYIGEVDPGAGQSESRSDDSTEKGNHRGGARSDLSEGNSSRRNQALPPRLAAWIFLLHDLVWNWKSDHLVENIVRHLGERINAIPPRLAPPRPLDCGWAWRMERKNRKKSWKHLPFPKFDTFRQLDRFLAIWSHHLEPHGSNGAGLNKDMLLEKWNDAEEKARLSDSQFKEFVCGLTKKSSSVNSLPGLSRTAPDRSRRRGD